jgi:methylmalonyl-CoA mutase N-terminal domain/subunit
MVAAIEAGFPQRAIADTAFATELAVESGEKRVVGVNCYRLDADDPTGRMPLHEVDDSARTRQLDAIARHRATRDGAAVSAALARVAQAAAGDDNLVEPLIDAAQSGATIGEMMQVLVDRFGEYREQFAT